MKLAVAFVCAVCVLCSAFAHVSEKNIIRVSGRDDDSLMISFTVFGTPHCKGAPSNGGLPILFENDVCESERGVARQVTVNGSDAILCVWKNEECVNDPFDCSNFTKGSCHHFPGYAQEYSFFADWNDTDAENVIRPGTADIARPIEQETISLYVFGNPHCNGKASNLGTPYILENNTCYDTGLNVSRMASFNDVSGVVCDWTNTLCQGIPRECASFTNSSCNHFPGFAMEYGFAVEWSYPTPNPSDIIPPMPAYSALSVLFSKL